MITKTIRDIFVYADWQGLDTAQLIGVLTPHKGRADITFSFEYDAKWLKSAQSTYLDPDIQLFSGQQYPLEKENFGVFLDNMPDTWGRTLMKRKAILSAKEKGIAFRNLNDIDFLLGVFDITRMGGLRFKTELEGPFLDNDSVFPTPPWAKIRDLQFAAYKIQEEDNTQAANEWLNILIAPGSSLGGARPKANVLGSQNQLWIAKFPSKNDDIDKGLWEYLTYQLALNAGIKMSLSKVEKVSGSHHTFFTQRFDRKGRQRIHFASAMTMTGFTEKKLRETTASYLNIAEFIHYHGANIKVNLAQLWRRIVFNMAISNTDDHLRNHGFLLTPHGWELSPAYDLNPSIDKYSLTLNVNFQDNSLDLDLAKSVGEYFQLSNQEMEQIIVEVIGSVKNWNKVATKLKIPRSEQELMASAFRF